MADTRALTSQNKEKIDQALNTFLKNVFDLLPDFVKNGRTVGDALEIKLPQPLKNHNELVTDPDYPVYAVQCIYEMFRAAKEIDFLKDSKWNDRFDVTKMMIFTRKLGVARLNEMKSYTQYVDPMMYLYWDDPDSQNENRMHEFFQQDDIWLQDGIGDAYRKIKKNKNSVILQKTTKPTEIIELKRNSSWLPHVVDELTLQLVKHIEAFLREIAGVGPKLPEHNQIWLKLTIIQNRIQRYATHVFPKLLQELKAVDNLDDLQRFNEKAEPLMILVSDVTADINTYVRSNEELKALNINLCVERDRRFKEFFTAEFSGRLAEEYKKNLAVIQAEIKDVESCYGALMALKAKLAAQPMLLDITPYQDRRYIRELKEYLERASKQDLLFLDLEISKKLTQCREIVVHFFAEKCVNWSLELKQINEQYFSEEKTYSLEQLKEILEILKFKSKAISQDEFIWIAADEDLSFKDHLHKFNEKRQEFLTLYQEKMREIQGKMTAIEVEDSAKSKKQIAALSKTITFYVNELDKIDQAERKVAAKKELSKLEIMVIHKRHQELQDDLEKKETELKAAQYLVLDLDGDENEEKLIELQEMVAQKRFKDVSERFTQQNYHLILGDHYPFILEIVDRNVQGTDRSWGSYLNAQAWRSYRNMKQDDPLTCQALVGKALAELQGKKSNVSTLQKKLQEARNALVEFNYADTLLSVAEEVSMVDDEKNKQQAQSYQRLDQQYAQLLTELEQPKEDAKLDYQKCLVEMKKAFVERQKLKTKYELKKYNDQLQILKNILQEKVGALAFIAERYPEEDLDIICEQRKILMIEKIREIKKITEETQEIIRNIAELKEVNDLQESLKSQFDDLIQARDAFELQCEEFMAMIDYTQSILQEMVDFIDNIIYLEQELQRLDSSIASRDYNQELQKYRLGESDFDVKNEFKFYEDSLAAIQKTRTHLAVLSKQKILTEHKDFPGFHFIQEKIEKCQRVLDVVHQNCLAKQQAWHASSEFVTYGYLLSRTSFTGADVQQINGHNVSGIKLSAVRFEDNPVGRHERAVVPNIMKMQDIQFDYTVFTDCVFDLPMDNVSFKGATLINCAFASFRGVILDETTCLDWNLHAEQILMDQLTQPPLSSNDEPGLIKLIGIISEKNPNAITSALILALLNMVHTPKMDPGMMQPDLQAVKARAIFMVKEMVVKISSLDELAKLHELLTHRSYAYLRSGFLDHTFKNIIQSIRARAESLLHETQETFLTTQTQEQINRIMNYDQSSLLHHPVNIGDQFFKDRLSADTKEHKNNLANRVETFSKLAQQYDAESNHKLQHTRFFKNRKARDYRRKLFVAALHLLNDKTIGIDEIKKIQHTIRTSAVTHAGAQLELFGVAAKYRTVQIPQDLKNKYITYDSIPVEERKRIVIWGQKIDGSEGDDPSITHGTTLGGFLMNRICENLIQIKQNPQEEGMRNKIAEDLDQLYCHYDNLPKLDGCELVEQSFFIRWLSWS